MTRWMTGIGIWVLGGGMALGQAGDAGATKARLDEVAKSYTGGNAYMGTVLVVEGDLTLLDKGYGMADVGWGIANEPAVKFRLGSLTKQFTAALVLLLQEEGKLKLDAPVSAYLPDAPKSWEKITLRNLLGHTSGIPNFTDDPGFAVWSMSAHTPAELLAYFRDKPLGFEPGAQYAYSNSNFEVLGVVIEKVSGKTYGAMLQERIFGPLGMKETGLDQDDLILKKRAQGYAPGKGGLRVARSESMTVPWAAGALYSTTGDLLKWERGLFGGKVLKEESLKAMTTPGKGEYGLGVGTEQRQGLKVVSHGGGIEGFNTHLSYVPERKIVVVVLSNVNGMAPQAMAGQLLDVMLGKPVVLKSERTAVPIAKAELQKFAGVYDLAPTFALTIAVSGDVLTAQATGQQAYPLSYAGVEGGHPRFFLTVVNAEVEFVPDAAGAMTSLVLHQAGEHIAKRR